jgi:hypothetical protein
MAAAILLQHALQLPTHPHSNEPEPAAEDSALPESNESDPGAT